MPKDRQTFINDYATRAIANGMSPGEAWAQAGNMADRAINLGHITGDIYETEAALDRADAFLPEGTSPTPLSMEDMRMDAARKALGTETPAVPAVPTAPTASPEVEALAEEAAAGAFNTDATQ